MQNKRTPDEEVARQLKIITYQLVPLAAIGRVGIWLALILIGLGILSLPFLGIHF